METHTGMRSLAPQQLRVLIVEDSPRDAKLVLANLKRAGFEVAFDVVDDVELFAQQIKETEYDIIISDHSLPGWSPLEAASILKENSKDIPFIVVTGALDDQTAVECVKQGAADYILKDRMARLPSAVLRALEEKRLRDERQRAELALQQSEKQYRLLFEDNPHPMWVCDAETLRFLAVNQAAVANYGFSREEFLGMTIKDITPAEDIPALLQKLALDHAGVDRAGDWRHRRKDGTVIRVEITSQATQFNGRRAEFVLANDVTERKQLEEQLRQSQKMEAVGQLAGGVAHDFNNLLTVINGYSELMLREVGANSPFTQQLTEIKKCGDRAADLTRQLLAFSRRQALCPENVNLNALIMGVHSMLQRLIPENIDLATIPAKQLGTVKADPGQIEQIILNLVVNARDAMPDGGKLTIETANVDLDEVYAREHLGMKPGPHVMLAVSDTGVGMDKEIQKRIFEPFFTTKEKGKGTGLGLSTVYGIVQQSGGNIWVYSEPGHGSSFKIYLPVAGDRPDAIHADNKDNRPRGGTETILLVEDEEPVRALIKRTLVARGYRVLDAGNGAQALSLSNQHKGTFKLLITDLMMPDMSGWELAERLGRSCGDMKVLFMSGYTNEDILRRGALTPEVAFLQKPFSPDAIAHKVREVLDSRKND